MDTNKCFTCIARANSNFKSRRGEPFVLHLVLRWHSRLLLRRWGRGGHSAYAEVPSKARILRRVSERRGRFLRRRGVGTAMGVVVVGRLWSLGRGQCSCTMSSGSPPTSHWFVSCDLFFRIWNCSLWDAESTSQSVQIFHGVLASPNQIVKECNSYWIE